MDDMSVERAVLSEETQAVFRHDSRLFDLVQISLLTSVSNWRASEIEKRDLRSSRKEDHTSFGQTTSSSRWRPVGHAGINGCHTTWPCVLVRQTHGGTFRLLDPELNFLK
jgi:hypothetical protein